MAVGLADNRDREVANSPYLMIHTQVGGVRP